MVSAMLVFPAIAERFAQTAHGKIAATSAAVASLVGDRVPGEHHRAVALLPAAWSAQIAVAHG